MVSGYTWEMTMADGSDCKNGESRTKESKMMVEMRVAMVVMTHY